MTRTLSAREELAMTKDKVHEMYVTMYGWFQREGMLKAGRVVYELSLSLHHVHDTWRDEMERRIWIVPTFDVPFGPMNSLLLGLSKLLKLVCSLFWLHTLKYQDSRKVYR